MRWLRGVIVLGWIAWLPIPAEAQPPFSAETPTRAQAPGAPTPISSRWDVSLQGRVGYPVGHLRAGDDDARGTRLSLRGDFGIEISQAVEASLGFHVTQRDALRLSYLHYFLEGEDTIGRPASFNGEMFGAGRINGDVDFSRLSLAYERLFTFVPGASLIGSVGLTYVFFDPEITVEGRSIDQDFRHDWPAPIVGLRFEVPLGPRGGVQLSAGGGGLPGDFEQLFFDVGIGLSYRLAPALHLTAAYYAAYLLLHDQRDQEDNRFELNDSGVRLGLLLRF